MNNEQQCKCELDGFQGAIWKGDCPLHKDDDKFIPHTNNNWIEQFDKEFVNSDYTLDFEDGVTTEKMKQFISNILTKKDQEHKAELEMIKGEIASKENKDMIATGKATTWSEIGLASDYNQAIQDSLSVLDSHINKL